MRHNSKFKDVQACRKRNYMYCFTESLTTAFFSHFLKVYITIDDINDNCPEFLNGLYFGTVPESAEDGTSIIDVIATDKDQGLNAQIVYTIKQNSITSSGL